MNLGIVNSLAAVCLATAIPTAGAHAATLIVDVSGAQSFSTFGTPGNFVQTYAIGAGSRITNIAYNVNITAFTPSWLSEAVLGMTTSDLLDGLFLSPGFDDNGPGTASYAGSANLVDLGLDFAVGADGILRLEYFEDFDDSGLSPDGIWNSGTVTLTYDAVSAAVPEPATWGLMVIGFGLTGVAIRRRRPAPATA